MSQQAVPTSSRTLPGCVLGMALMLFLLVVLKNAWVCDDAFILLRTVDNALHGYGLTFNVVERVQTFSTPLWTLLLIPAVGLTGEVYFTILAVSLVVTVATLVVLCAGLAPSSGLAAFGVILLTSSRAFVDFSTSGLAHPLTCLLLAGFLVQHLRRGPAARQLFWMALLAGCATTNRMDTLLLFLPALCQRAVGLGPRPAMRPLLLGFLPFFLWEGFALFYYGSLVPNTAFAKLAGGVPLVEVFEQGLFYLLHSGFIDPLTSLTILAALGLGLLRGGPAVRAVCVGMILYLLYLVWIGGCFMSGRHHTAPLLAAVAVLLVQLCRASGRTLLVLSLLAVALALLPRHSHLLTGRGFGAEADHEQMIRRRIHDERATFFQTTGLLNVLRGDGRVHHPWQVEGERLRRIGPAVVATWSLGLLGYHAGPRVHLIDRWALADPLLARLPGQAGRAGAGHVPRMLPNGYLATLRSGANQIRDPGLARYHDLLVRVTRGPLLDGARWRALIGLLLGRHDALLKAYVARPPERVPLAQLATLPEPDSPWWNDAAALGLNPAGVEVVLDGTSNGRIVHLALNTGPEQSFPIEFLLAGEVVGRVTLDLQSGSRETLSRVRIEVPERAVERGFDVIRVLPGDADGIHVLGQLGIER